jgi:hypothetical protein
VLSGFEYRGVSPWFVSSLSLEGQLGQTVEDIDLTNVSSTLIVLALKMLYPYLVRV